MGNIFHSGSEPVIPYHDSNHDVKTFHGIFTYTSYIPIHDEENKGIIIGERYQNCTILIDSPQNHFKKGEHFSCLAVTYNIRGWKSCYNESELSKHGLMIRDSFFSY